MSKGDTFEMVLHMRRKSGMTQVSINLAFLSLHTLTSNLFGCYLGNVFSNHAAAYTFHGICGMAPCNRIILFLGVLFSLCVITLLP